MSGLVLAVHGVCVGVRVAVTDEGSEEIAKVRDDEDDDEEDEEQEGGMHVDAHVHAVVVGDRTRGEGEICACMPLEGERVVAVVVEIDEQHKPINEGEDEAEDNEQNDDEEDDDDNDDDDEDTDERATGAHAETLARPDTFICSK
jgi:hypothetical protein